MGGMGMNGWMRCWYVVLWLAAVAGLAPGSVLGEDLGTARVAVLPFAVNASKDLAYLQDGVRDMLASRLSSGGGVRVIEKARVDAAAKGRPASNQEADIRALGSALGVDYVISGSLTALAGGVSLDARAFPVSPGKNAESFFATAPRENDVIVAIDTLSWDIGERLFGRQRPQAKLEQAPVSTPSAGGAGWTTHPDRALKMAGSGQAGGSQNLIMAGGNIGAKGFVKTQNLKLAMQAMDIGDLDGDGQEEVVVGAPGEVLFYHRDGNKLLFYWRIPVMAGRNVHAVNTADLNGNGKREVYVSAADAEKPNSFAVEWEGNEFKYIFKDAPWYVRPVNIPGEGMVLAGQKAAVDRPILAGVFRLVQQGGQLLAGAKIDVPNEVNLFDFSLADVDGDGRVETVGLDQYDRLRLYRQDGTVAWKSDEVFGGTKRFLGGKKLTATGGRSGADEPERIYVPSRIIVADVNGDGQDDIVLNKNQSGTPQVFKRVKDYPSGEIYALTWNGLALAELWRTRKIDGYIVDYQLRIKEDKANADLLVGIVLQSSWLNVLSADESTVLIYPLGLKPSGEAAPPAKTK